MLNEIQTTKGLPTVRLVLEQGARQLRKAGIDSEKLEMSLILAEVLGIDRARLYADPDRPLNDAQHRAACSMLERRLKREPLAYILGRREFFGLEFNITSDVLIPRPETEHLVERAIAWIQARAGVIHEPLLADIGTGSGAIAVAVAQTCPTSRWIATDLSAAALEIARANARRHGVADRIQFRRGPMLNPITERLDGLVSNPPYVPDADRETLQPEVSHWEPAEALFSGPDGLNHIRELITAAPRRLRPGGLLLIECGQGQAETIIDLLARDGRYAPGRIHPDLAGINRIVETETL